MNPIHIVGRGAIGSLLAAKLVNLDRLFTCEVRSLNNLPKTVLNLDKSVTRLPAIITHQPNILDDSIVIVPLKAYQIENALRDLAFRLPKRASVVLLHNGMLDRKAIKALLPNHSIYLATTSHAAKREGSQIHITGTGTTQFGLAKSPHSPDAISTEIASIKSLFTRLISPVSYSDDIDQILWQKLIVNAVINPLTAIHNIKNGVLGDSAFTKVIMNIIQECIEVASTLSVQLEYTVMSELVRSVIQNTANNYSSMHQDLKNHRPSEIDYISGFIVSKGKENGVDVSENTRLLDQIKRLEQANENHSK
ncbi:2-dehydropantoate 2-reductase [Alteromonas sp. 5E99-2]|uniref:ketopantoate reductase family protein n=1 Tax=Alteromonas sp. 5E99-2 TaxID=2817683 RepID=UPI001A992923|nr:2-dehydropantoate 2-reductase [Alteromonas sp. 5E99-2]MBO1255989.1 2-dehydropantoate 2-reductase [Alteromonas sp. 5E99-2]